MQEQLTPDFNDYELIDTGDFEKLERFGRYVTRRPEPQAIWRRTLAEEEWRRTADASFRRDARSDERGEWRLALRNAPTAGRWSMPISGMRLRMRLGLTSFKHVGIFPEQAANWNFIYDSCRALAGGEPSGGGERVAEFGSSSFGRWRPQGAEPLCLHGRGDARGAGRRGRGDARRFGQAGGDLVAREHGAERPGGRAVDRRGCAEIRPARSAPRQPLPRNHPRSPRLTGAGPTASGGFWRTTSAKCWSAARSCSNPGERFWF